MGPFLWSDGVTFELTIQSTAADAEQARSRDFVTPRLLQGGQQILALKGWP